MGGERLTRKIYEGKKTKRGRPRKTRMEEVRKTYGVEEEKWKDTRKMCKEREK